MWKQTQLFGILCFGVCVVSGCSARFVKHVAKPYAQTVRRKGDIRRLKIGNSSLEVLIADTWRDRKFGLVGCESLKEDEGILFVFRREKICRLQMKFIDVPLSAAFITRDGAINEVIDLQPGRHGWIRSSEKALFALQVPRGWFEKNSVSEGDRVNIEEVTDRHYCPHYALDLGLQFEKQGGLKDALSCYQMVLHDYPSHVLATANIGNVHRQMGNYKKAALWYQKALKIKPSDMFAMTNLAELYLAKGEVPKNMCERLEKCVTGYPSCSEKACALDALARLYAHSGRYERALNSIELAIREAQVCEPKLLPELDSHKGLILVSMSGSHSDSLGRAVGCAEGGRQK